MATDKNILKGWFSNYKKPTQEQFWAWLESYWHKGEKIPVSELEGLNELLEAVQTPIVTDTYLIQVSLQSNKLRLVMSNEQVFEVDLSAVVGSGSGGITSVQWNDIQGKPSEFTPTTHTHIIDEVNGLQGVLDNKADTNHTHVVNWSDIQGKPSAFPSDTVQWSDIQNKPSAYPPSSHNHNISQITGLQQALNSKADVNHIHTLEPLEIAQNTMLTATHNNRILIIKGGNINLTLREAHSAGFTGCGIDVVEGVCHFGLGQGITLTGFSVAELNKDEKGYVYRMKQGENNFRLV